MLAVTVASNLPVAKCRYNCGKLRRCYSLLCLAESENAGQV